MRTGICQFHVLWRNANHSSPRHPRHESEDTDAYRKERSVSKNKGQGFGSVSGPHKGSTLPAPSALAKCRNRDGGGPCRSCCWCATAERPVARACRQVAVAHSMSFARSTRSKTERFTYTQPLPIYPVQISLHNQRAAERREVNQQ